MDDAHWSLTHNDGQLQVADICFTNFSYNRASFNDDSREHRLELGSFKVRNLMPNTPSVYQVQCVCVCVCVWRGGGEGGLVLCKFYS